MYRNKYLVASRSIWYLLRTLLITLAVVCVCYLVFLEGLFVSNIYILSTEGLSKRAGVILGTEDPLELTEYFTEPALANDSALSSNQYEHYSVSSYDYRVEVEGLSVLPWSSNASIDVLLRLAALNITPNNETVSKTPPVWPALRAKVHLVRDGSRWFINDIEIIEENPYITPAPTPDMSLVGQQ